MASPSDLRSFSVGLQRFGLGFRLGQRESVRREARELLLAEIASGSVAQPANVRFSSTAEIGAALYAFEDEEKLERESRRVAGQEPPAQGMQIAVAPPGQNQMVQQPKPSNELATPNGTYLEEVVACVALALDHPTGFGERLVQFWSNHFCIAVTKSGMCRMMAGIYEREAIRPYIFGHFEDMLIAAESHPAMLDFLENRLSIGPNSPAGKRRGRGLNENFAREILELHTLGVSGGYSQADVTNLARILTGWIVVGRDARLGFPGSFAFNPGLHEPGAPQLLSKRYDQPGKAKGLAALRDLARRPATADFIALKLARHFVADRPPGALVTKLSEIFRRTEGDLAAVSRALVETNASWAAEPTKIRSPQQFLIASFRALGHTPTLGQITSPLGIMGQSVWQPSGPNGYPDTNAAWGSAAGIKTRVDVASAWGQQMAGSVPDPRALTEDVLGPLLSPETRHAVARAESKPQALALLLMSPEFQRR